LLRNFIAFVLAKSTFYYFETGQTAISLKETMNNQDNSEQAYTKLASFVGKYCTPKTTF